ncbi:MAG: hypothetical protein ACREBC_20830 [Pyrinomonadaceae bacterium]
MKKVPVRRVSSNYRLTIEAKELLEQMAELSGITSKTGMLELIIREAASKRGLVYKGKK